MLTASNPLTEEELIDPESVNIINEIQAYWAYLAPYCAIQTSPKNNANTITTRRSTAIAQEDTNIATGWLDPDNIDYVSCLSCHPSIDLDELADDAVYEFAETSTTNALLLIKCIRALQKELVLKGMLDYRSRINNIYEELLVVHQLREVRRKKNSNKATLLK